MFLLKNKNQKPIYSIETESQNVHDENILHSSLFICTSHYIGLLYKEAKYFSHVNCGWNADKYFFKKVLITKYVSIEI